MAETQSQEPRKPKMRPVFVVGPGGGDTLAKLLNVSKRYWFGFREVAFLPPGTAWIASGYGLVRLGGDGAEPDHA